MIKRTLVDFIYERHGGTTRAEVEENVDILLDIVQEAIQNNDTVTITHFGRFRRKQRNVREIILPSGDRMLSTAGERVQFLPSPRLKTLLNEMPVGEDAESEAEDVPSTS